MLSCKRNGFAFIFYGKSSISFFHLSEIELLFCGGGNKMAEISRLKDKEKGKKESLTFDYLNCVRFSVSLLTKDKSDMAEKLKMWWLVWFGLMIFMTRYCKLVGLKLIENQFVFLGDSEKI